MAPSLLTCVCSHLRLFVAGSKEDEEETPSFLLTMEKMNDGCWRIGERMHFLLVRRVANKRARVFCQNLARGLSYAGSRAVCLPSKRQKMSRNNLWKFA